MMQKMMPILKLAALSAFVYNSIIPIEASHNNKVPSSIDVSELANEERALLSFLSKSSLARDEVIELIASEYTAKPSNEHDASDWLASAIEAMKFSETDGEPAAVKWHDFLFVGSVGASRNQEFMRKNGITHVINWSNTARCNVFDDVEYLCIDNVRGDKGMHRHLDDLDRAVDFVENVRQSGGRVLSHCWYGKNRSVTLIVAYLMKYEGMSAAEANDLVKETRPQAKPYWESLEEYARLMKNLS